MIIILLSAAQEELKTLGEKVGICFHFTNNKKVSLNSIYYIFLCECLLYFMITHRTILGGKFGLGRILSLASGEKVRISK